MNHTIIIAMGKKLIIAMLACMLSGTAFAQQLQFSFVSKEDALLTAMSQFKDQDVDYFLLNDYSRGEWSIFVDAEPMKGWEHDCYIINVPKTVSSSSGLKPLITFTKTKLNLPPQGDYEPLSVKNRYGDEANSLPRVKKRTLSNASEQAIANRTYAVILSGGANKIVNHERYWNDCSFIYQTLVNKYNIPKGNIYPLMSDGNDPGIDMRCVDGTYRSQPLDLDFDGVADIELAASRSNVIAVLTDLSTRLQKDDHLFIYVIDHGGDTKTAIPNSFIWLWGNEILYDYELARLINPLSHKLANINVVLGQCRSGGFIDELTKIGCVVASATSGGEDSQGCPDIPYDEFVYHWTCAINEATHTGESVDSDMDKNGRVTMAEAFDYAKRHDRFYYNEHPQYVSTPISVGEDLAFNYLPPSVDLYIKDNPEDTGKEPNLTTNQIWNSMSICIRNNDDGIFDHQNPEYSPSHQTAYVYVKVHNRGKEKYTGGKWLKVYWGQASTGLTANTWNGLETYNGEYPTGGGLEPVEIYSIEAGGYIVTSVEWPLPSLLANYPDENFHFCILACIVDDPDYDPFMNGDSGVNLKWNNDIAQKNLTIVPRENILKSFNVYVRNVSDEATGYSLAVIPTTEADQEFYSKGNIELGMSEKIYEAWNRGGLESQDVQLSAANYKNSDLRTVKLIAPDSKLRGIKLNKNEFDIVSLRFNYSDYNCTTPYSFDLVQRDENGHIIGGESFFVEAPKDELSPISTPVGITQTPIGLQYKLQADTTAFSSFKWSDGNDDCIGNSGSVIVTPTIDNCTYSVVGVSDEGEISTSSITLDVNQGIKTVAVSGSDIVVELYSEAPAEATVSIVYSLDGTMYLLKTIQEGVDSIVLTAPDRAGIYAILYSVNDEVVDQKKITIK